MHLRLTQR